MKTLIGFALLMCVLSMLTGCHSGIIRGAGSDISKLGDHMQQ